MKKGEIYQGKVVDIKFPNKGIVSVYDANNNSKIERRVTVKGTLPGQEVTVRLTKKKNENYEGNLVEVIKKAEYEEECSCRHFPMCGGCAFRTVPYEKQLEIKLSMVKRLLKDYASEELFEGIKESPVTLGYRNKMEFSFGDACKDGELELGLHKRGSFYDIVSVSDCVIADEDMRSVLKETLSYFRGKETPYYHKRTHEGYLRHLLIRKAAKTGEILVCLVTSSQKPQDTICTAVGLIEDWKDEITSLKLKGNIVGVLHITNDSVSDTIVNEHTDILYGQDYFYEELLGLKFRISPFSFFQTNSLSAEVLYMTARDFIMESMENKGTVFDLYSGTGTISQMIAPVVEHVIGVEIVEEAVEAAKKNAELNGLHNCDFIAGDVLKVLDEIDVKPDYIILDPPRDGINPKALKKIIDYGVDNLLYISCKPTSLQRDLEMLSIAGYEVKRVCCIDQFPCTTHVETVCLLSKK